MNIRFKKLNKNAVTPTYGSEHAAGADLYACFPNDCVCRTYINDHETVMVGTGIAVEIPEGYVGLIYARSGMAIKRGLAPANKVGVIDADYRGEIMVALHNHGVSAAGVEHGERIAQLVIAPVIHADFEEVDELSDTERGNGGFGSTGEK